MYLLNNHLRRKEILLIFFRHFVEMPAKKSTVNGLLLTSDNSAWEIEVRYQTKELY